MSASGCDAVLRAALLDALRQDWTEALRGEMPEPTFSRRYQEQRRKLLADPFAYGKRAARPLWRRAVKTAACILLALGISAGAVLTVSPDARAWVQQVVVSWFEDHVDLTFDGDMEEGMELSAWEPTYLPEGFEVVDREEREGYMRIEYGDEEGNAIYLTCMAMDSGSKYSFNNEDSIPQQVVIQGKEVTLFKAQEEGKKNRLILLDEEAGITYILVSKLDAEELIKIAESVERMTR